MFKSEWLRSPNITKLLAILLLLIAMILGKVNLWIAIPVFIGFFDVVLKFRKKK